MKITQMATCLFCVAIIFGAATLVPASAKDAISSKKLAGGRTFELKYSQTSTFATNMDTQNSYHLHDGKGNSLFRTNSSGQVTMHGVPIANYDYTAIGYIMSVTNLTPLPFWTNQGSWGNMMIGLRTGFEFFDAESAGDEIMLCYKEQFDVFIEKVSLKKNGTSEVAGSRQKIYSDNPAYGYSITNAVFVSSNGLPVQIVATGSVPSGKITWKQEGEKWVQETQIIKHE